MRWIPLLLLLTVVGLSCRRRAGETGDIIGPPGAGAVHLYVEEQVVGDSVDVALFFTSQPWGEGTAQSVDSVAVDGEPLTPVSPGTYLFRKPAVPDTVTLYLSYAGRETVLSLPVDTLYPPDFLTPSFDTTVTPGDTLNVVLSRPAQIRVFQDTVLIQAIAGLRDSVSLILPAGLFRISAEVWDTLMEASLHEGTINVHAGGKRSIFVQVGSQSGYTLQVDTLGPGCSGAAPCFSWTPADSLERLSVYRKTYPVDELIWSIAGNPDPQDSARVIPFVPPVIFGQSDPFRYEELHPPSDTIRPGETYWIRGFRGGTSFVLGEFQRGG